MKMNLPYSMSAYLLTVLLFLLCGTAVSAQSADSALMPAKTAMEQKDYRTAAKEAANVFFFSGDSKVAEEAMRLSIRANTAIRDAGGKVSETWSAELDKQAKRLLVLTSDRTIYRCFSFQCGEDFSVPSGEFQVGPKLGYPNFELNGVFYKTGSAGNTLGSRWIELRNAEGVPATGIHGEAPLAGDDAEQLFFRLKNSDINELFVLLNEGSKVLVK